MFHATHLHFSVLLLLQAHLLGSLLLLDAKLLFAIRAHEAWNEDALHWLGGAWQAGGGRSLDRELGRAANVR